MTPTLLANIFCTVGIAFLALSSFLKAKDKILYMQIGNYGFFALGDLIIGSFAGSVVNAISIIRNVLAAKGKDSRFVQILMLVSIVGIGIAVNVISGNVGILYFVPIIASAQYTLCAFICKSAQALRVAMIVFLILWFIHDFGMAIYTSAAVDLLVAVITLVNCFRLKDA
ncbi:MAG: YgjV family protein [Lachnospiraceae bacterium]|nr:YgjV family protein [Lachnospiraceae bacterium]